MNLEKILLIIISAILCLNLFLHLNDKKNEKETYEEHSKEVVKIINATHKENLRHFKALDSIINLKQQKVETKIEATKTESKANKRMIKGIEFVYDSITKDFVLPIPEGYKEEN